MKRNGQCTYADFEGGNGWGGECVLRDEVKLKKWLLVIYQ